jgi:hypothetical protein
MAVCQNQPVLSVGCVLAAENENHCLIEECAPSVRSDLAIRINFHQDKNGRKNIGLQGKRPNTCAGGGRRIETGSVSACEQTTDCGCRRTGNGLPNIRGDITSNLNTASRQKNMTAWSFPRMDNVPFADAPLPGQKKSISSLLIIAIKTARSALFFVMNATGALGHFMTRQPFSGPLLTTWIVFCNTNEAA